MPGDAYRRMASIYDPLLDPWLNPLRRAVAEMALRHGWRRVLDVGGGTGRQCQVLAAAGVACMVIDHSPAMLRVARQRRGPLLEVVQGDATHLPLASPVAPVAPAATAVEAAESGVDAVLFSLCLHEMPPAMRLAALQEAARVARAVVVVEYALDQGPRWGSWAVRLAVHVPERMAGRQHYAMFRDFLARGGVQGLLRTAGYAVRERRDLYQGALAVILARPAAGG
ncbi:MAG: class I SAM-dependent methyltransferase [Desulfovibrio sp.]|nr:class I SAM-dependent methyltransferase [Desulfovibrio sp.]